MENIVIRFADLEDFDRVIDFLRENWNENHIFVRHPEILRYQHCVNGKFNYTIAEGDISKKIYGVNGFIIINHEKRPDIFGALWKIIKSPNPILGLEMEDFLRDSLNYRVCSGIGLSKMAKKIYMLKKEPVGILNHYYRLADIDEYNISIVNDKQIVKYFDEKSYKLVVINSIDELLLKFDYNKYKDRLPYKDNEYIDYRYFKYPIYKYNIYGIYVDDLQFNSILVAREIECNGSKILRIVDFIGIDNELRYIGEAIQNMIDSNNYEYVDFYNYGLSNEIMNDMGFKLKDEKDKNIIPNYFEPFVQENITLDFTTTCIDNFYAFKADADQDRPNVL